MSYSYIISYNIMSCHIAPSSFRPATLPDTMSPSCGDCIGNARFAPYITLHYIMRWYDIS